MTSKQGEVCKGLPLPGSAITAVSLVLIQQIQKLLALPAPTLQCSEKKAMKLCSKPMLQAPQYLPPQTGCLPLSLAGIRALGTARYHPLRPGIFLSACQCLGGTQEGERNTLRCSFWPQRLCVPFPPTATFSSEPRPFPKPHQVTFPGPPNTSTPTGC